MPSLKLRMRVLDRSGVLTTGLDRRLNRFLDDVDRQGRIAAKAATVSTRSNFTYKREIQGRRPGRSSTGGRMKSYLEWTYDPVTGKVAFNSAKADKAAPQWIIQEIGTGERATIRRANQSNPRGRPRKGATHVRTVPSQVGRRIHRGLVFASGGQYSPPGSAQREQIQWASTVTGVPARLPNIRITKEIAGQHFVQRGGNHGFREFQNGTLAAARRAFQKKGGRP